MACVAPSSRRPIRVVLRLRKPRPVQPPCPKPVELPADLARLQRWLDLSA